MADNSLYGIPAGIMDNPFSFKGIARETDNTVSPHLHVKFKSARVTLKEVSRNIMNVKKEMKRLKADLIRETGLFERLCDRGVGHPVGHMRGWLWDFELVHGCYRLRCGKCPCTGWPTQEVREYTSRLD